MQYRGFFIYPPRPQGLLEPGGEFFQALQGDRDWTAQAKLNGSNTVARIRAGEVQLWNRHGKPATYRLPSALQKFLVEHFDDCVINFELMHQKTPHIKDTIYLYDLLVFRGEWLVGRTYGERFELLKLRLPRLIRHLQLPVDVVTPGVWLARCIPSGWIDLYDRYGARSEFEGLMLKKLTAPLQPGLSEQNNQHGSIRARKKVVKL